MYATYSYYKNQFFGGKLEAEDFYRYAKRACAEIDRVTFGRLTSMPESEIQDAVRDAVCAVAEQMYSFENAKGAEIASESNDGVSVSYRDVSDKRKQEQAISQTLRTYLAQTGLMFRGAYSHTHRE